MIDAALVVVGVVGFPMLFAGYWLIQTGNRNDHNGDEQ